MNIRDSDTYNFNALPSRHEAETRALEKAVASNCTTLRTYRQEYKKIVDFRRMTHLQKLEKALWRVAWQLPNVDDANVAALCSEGNLHTIASMLGQWLGAHGTPAGWVTGIHLAEEKNAIPGPRAAYCIRRLVEFAQGVIDARGPDDIEIAALYLVDAAESIDANVLIDVLLKRATVQIRYPTSNHNDVVKV